MCGGAGILSGYNHGDNSANWIKLGCNRCGFQFDYATKSADGSWKSDNWWTLYNMSSSSASSYKCSKTTCGKNDKTIESMEIAFN